MQVMYHFFSKNTIPSRHKHIQPFPVKLHKNSNYNKRTLSVPLSKQSRV